jgi:hypothetical protein
MAWPRTKKPRSSALPVAREHEGVHVTAAPDADPAPGSGQNTGVSGTRHTVAGTGPARPSEAQPTDARDPGGPDDAGYAGDAGYDETAGITYEVEPKGFEVLGFEPAGEIGQPAAGGESPAQPGAIEPPTLGQPAADEQAASAGGQPAWNQTMASAPRPVSPDEENSRQGPFGGIFRRGGGAEGEGGDPPPLTRVRDLPLDQRMRIWRLRALIVVIVGVVFSIIANWELGLTLAIVAGIADTVYRSRTVESRHVPQSGTVDRASWRAQRRTQKQLAKMERSGYLALHRRPIPDSVEVIDHLVVGPTGVYAIDSEKWDKALPIRTRNGKQLWHGPKSMKDRLEHARWEAGQASERLSAALGTEVQVQPALAIYGPKIPWDVTVIRDVDVFSGDRLQKYLRRRAKRKNLPHLSHEQIRKIYQAASAVLPLDASRTTTPVG